MTQRSFAEDLTARADALAQACTGCGRCFEVCPMTGPAELDHLDAGAVVAAVRDLLRDRPGTPAAERWASICSGSGSCIPACPEAINPRLMLTLARLAIARRQPVDRQRQTGARAFRKMSRAVRVLSRMQLPPDVLARFDAEDGEPTADDAHTDVVFYTGCNLRRTPHIALLCFDIMDALGVRYRVMGGPQMCCGIIQLRAGDLTLAENVAYRTSDHFAAAKPSQVLAWCPTCHIQFSETVLPGRRSQAPERFGFDMVPFVVFLASKLDQLRHLMNRRVNKRVGLHEHPGVTGVTEAAERILRAVPGLELVDLTQPSVGYMCNQLQSLPDYKRSLHARLLQAAAAANLDALAGVYHVCHRELCTHERDWPFAVVNFLELVAESMGLCRRDAFKRLKKIQDANAILTDVADLAAVHRLPLEVVQDVVLEELLGEQPLPLVAGNPGADAG